MSHDTEPEEVKLVSIVEREAEEAYPVQFGEVHHRGRIGGFFWTTRRKLL